MAGRRQSADLRAAFVACTDRDAQLALTTTALCLLRRDRAVEISPMIQKCDNPTCARTLDQLPRGRFFLVESRSRVYATRAVKVVLGTRQRVLHYFWLCDECCRTGKYEKGSHTA